MCALRRSARAVQSFDPLDEWDDEPMSRVSIREVPPLAQAVSVDVPAFPWGIWGLRHMVGRLGICESRRRLLHMLPGLLPLGLWVIPHKDPWGIPLIVAFMGILAAVISYAIVRESDFARPDESLWHLSVMGYTIPIIALVFLLPGRSELAMMTLGVLAFGDGSAVLGGKLLKGPSLPWNVRKTWAGLFSFVIAGSAAASLYYWIEARPTVDFSMALCIAGSAAIVGAITESLPIRSHDNFRVGVVAALTGLLMNVLLLGW